MERHQGEPFRRGQPTAQAERCGDEDGDGGAHHSTVPRRLSALAAALAAILIVSGCTDGAGGPPTGNSSTVTAGGSAAREPEPAGRVDGLALPWSTVFLPDGTAIISERDSAELKSVQDGRISTLGKVPGVVPGGEGGLLGLALSPDFVSDRLLYTYFTGVNDNRIARLRLDRLSSGSVALGTPEVVFAGIPKASTHNGGRIRFGPDGDLYVGTGDAQRRDQPQDAKALGGKILRITRDGKPAPGNPFAGSPVYSMGHRNVQGLAWDEEGRLWASEFGPDVNDELNLIQAGGNYGWPDVTGAPGRKGFIDAKVVWPATADSSPSGLEIVGHTAYLGALRGERLWAVPLDGENAGNPVSHFTGRFGRIRDVKLAPDGRLWMLTNGQNPDFAVILALPR